MENARRDAYISVVRDDNAFDKLLVITRLSPAHERSQVCFIFMTGDKSSLMLVGECGLNEFAAPKLILVYVNAGKGEWRCRLRLHAVISSICRSWKEH